ncbi:MAG: 30S ribosomal protein S5 [Chloroflexi bacterium]|nr:30S ribosomal protein S5 [Chloroflexota bacterium]
MASDVGIRDVETAPEAEITFSEKLVHLRRVAKVVKGGRHLSFSALVVVGDGRGRVGAAMGKANDVPSAIRKAAERAKKHLFEVPMVETTIPHPITVKFGAAQVLLKPASRGTGIIAGGGVRAVVEAAGIKDVITKSLGSRNRINVVWATAKALQNLRSPGEVGKRRGAGPGDEGAALEARVE